MTQIWILCCLFRALGHNYYNTKTDQMHTYYDLISKSILQMKVHHQEVSCNNMGIMV
jgi:hypothetical protein